MPRGIYDRNTLAVLQQCKEHSERMKVLWQNPEYRNRLLKHLPAALEKRWDGKRQSKDFPVNPKKIPEYKLMLDKIFGASCFVCGYSKRLELHHLWYEVDSEQRNSQGTIERMIEAIQHPERFVRLCKSCHSSVTMVQHNGPLIIERIIEVIELGMTKGTEEKWQENQSG